MSDLELLKEDFPSKDDLDAICMENRDNFVFELLQEISGLAFEAADKAEREFFFDIKLMQYRSRFIWKDCIQEILSEKGFKIKQVSGADDTDSWVRLLIMW